MLWYLDDGSFDAVVAGLDGNHNFPGSWRSLVATKDQNVGATDRQIRMISSRE
jgi:hypothetical protein